MIKNSQVMKYFLCRFIREKITVEGIAEKWGRVLYFSAIIAAVNVNIHKPNRKILRRLDDRGLFRLNWSPRDEDLSVDKIEENVNLNFKAEFFYTKLLFLTKSVQILNIKEYLIGSLLNNLPSSLFIFTSFVKLSKHKNNVEWKW